MFRHILTIPSEPVNITASPNVSAKDILADDGFEVYPNPLSDGSLTVKLPDNTQYLTILDMTGKTIFEKKVSQNIYHISHSLFSSNGVYVVKIQTAKKALSKKITVKK
ncbi:MAG: T9SS type A sorting domain-containing protein [Draconibacterium sp.]|nr:T9SS type A sorting domain-containing protein [Draconibacterium sp.]